MKRGGSGGKRQEEREKHDKRIEESKKDKRK